MLDAAIIGLIGILQWKAFMLMMFGIIISSTLVAMPGIGSKTAIALLLPIAFCVLVQLVSRFQLGMRPND